MVLFIGNGNGNWTDDFIGSQRLQPGRRICYRRITYTVSGIGFYSTKHIRDLSLKRLNDDRDTCVCMCVGASGQCMRLGLMWMQVVTPYFHQETRHSTFDRDLAWMHRRHLDVRAGDITGSGGLS